MTSTLIERIDAAILGLNPLIRSPALGIWTPVDMAHTALIEARDTIIEAGDALFNAQCLAEALQAMVEEKLEQRVGS